MNQSTFASYRLIKRCKRSQKVALPFFTPLSTLADHPSLSLIKFSIDDPHEGDYLASLFPVDAAGWGKANENKDIHPSNSTRTD
jgi:hypothetical protein